MYLDDIIIGGTTEDTVQDLGCIQSAAEKGLCLNKGKFEIICHDHIMRGQNCANSQVHMWLTPPKHVSLVPLLVVWRLSQLL